VDFLGKQIPHRRLAVPAYLAVLSVLDSLWPFGAYFFRDGLCSIRWKCLCFSKAGDLGSGGVFDCALTLVVMKLTPVQCAAQLVSDVWFLSALFSFLLFSDASNASLLKEQN
jgi:hypothetical protein